MSKKKKYRCKKCKTECLVAYGIGPYCPDASCKNADFGIEEVRDT